MLDFINKILKSFLGSKSDRDFKETLPYVEKVNSSFSGLAQLSNDELRAKTESFKQHIQNHISEIGIELTQLTDSAESNLEMDLHEKEKIFTRVDELKKERNKKIEEALMEIHADAFAVVKETARRFTEVGDLQVTATQHDRDIAVKRSGVVINGDQATYKKSWLAAGIEVTWDMIHYDVQLIGGTVLHQGKIAEMGTGEGKTLVATLPLYLNALAGRGVHVVTVNDYLAKRDSEWNGPIFEFLGLSVDCIDKHQPNSPERR